MISVINRPVTIPPVEYLLELALDAGKAIMAIYNDPLLLKQVAYKLDDSPLTLADETSHNIIVEGLRALTPDIPVISEEAHMVPYAQRKHWDYFWCIDPLDGTKEFLQRNGEFTVNIALIHKQRPVLGIICIPASGSLYYGSRYTGSWKIVRGSGLVRLQTDKKSKEWIAVNSRSHVNLQEKEVMEQFPVSKQINVGSSIKFCLVAEGSAHVYYRQGPTMEWDTAAGHAIVEFSGGRVFMASGEAFLYNKKSQVNGPFICMAQCLPQHSF